MTSSHLDMDMEAKMVLRHTEAPTNFLDIRHIHDDLTRRRQPTLYGGVCHFHATPMVVF